MSRHESAAATTESHEQREERWIDWTQRAWQHCPLNLYDEHQKLGEIAVGEMLNEIARLQAALIRIERLSRPTGGLGRVEYGTLARATEIAREALDA